MRKLIFNSFVTLFVVIDPLGLAPIFAALTRSLPEKARREAAIRGVALAAGILFLFALVGDGLLAALGIGIPAFRIAGGALLFLLSVDIIFRSNRTTGARSSAAQEAEEDPHREDISVFPLAIPLIAGPGSLTTVLLYTGGTGFLETITVLGVLLVVLSLTLAALLLAPRILGVFGETGTNVFSRVLGVLLAALAVQFVLDGIRASFDLV